MSILCIGTPPGKAVPESEYNFNWDEDRFFLPGALHGGDYVLSAFAYQNEEGDKMEIKYLWPEDIITAAKTATDYDGNFHRDVFIDVMSCAETFIIENTPNDPNFCYFNESWKTEGKAMTPEELIAWAKEKVGEQHA